MEARQVTGEHSGMGRRALLGAGLAGAGVVALPAVPAAAAPARHHRKHTPVTVPPDEALHAIRRLGYGPTPHELATVREQGVKRWLHNQLTWDEPDTHDAIDKTMFFSQEMTAKNIAGLYNNQVHHAVAGYEWATLYRSM